MKKTLPFIAILLLSLSFVAAADSQSIGWWAGDYFDNTNSSSFTGNITNGDSSYSLAVTFYADSLDNTANGLVGYDSGGSSYGYGMIFDYGTSVGNHRLGFSSAVNGVTPVYTSEGSITTGTWYTAVAVSTGTLEKIYLSTGNNASKSRVGDYNSARVLGERGDGYYWNGYIVNYTEWDFSLSEDEINNYFLCGETTTCAITVNTTLTFYDAWNNSLINNVSATINSTTYYNTTGSVINTPIPKTDSYEYTINVSGANHISKNITFNASENLDVYLYPYNSVNITFKYEDTYSVANDTTVTAVFISPSYTVESNTSTGQLNLTLPYPDSYQIRYQATGYSPRFYTFTLTNGTYNELELLLPADSSSNVTIYVKDTLGNPLEDATVKVLKFFPAENDYIQVASVVTNFEGRIVESIEVGVEFYQFVIEYTGSLVLTTSPSYVYDDELTLYVNLLGAVFNPTFTRVGLYGLITYTPNNTFTYTFSDKDNLASQGCLFAYNTNWNTETLVNSSCVSGASGSTYVTVDNTTGKNYLFKGYITRDGVNYYVTSFSWSYGDTPTEDGNGLLMAVILIIAFSLIGFWRLEAAVVFAGLATMLLSIMGVILLPITYTAGLFVLSLITAFIISKRRAA